MATAYSEPGALVLSLFDNLIDRIKSSRPVRTDGKSLTSGFVYSQLVLGMPVDPGDYTNPWSPAGGGTVQDAKSAQPAIAASPASGSSGGAAAGAAAGAANGGAAAAAPAAPGLDPKVQKAINAAWKTSRLVDTMIMVTNDDSFQEYPTSRHVSFSYDGIINGMQSMPSPPVSPDVQKQIDAAMNVLYLLDTDGSILGKSQLYKLYVKNAEAYAQAKTDFAIAQASALGNPATASSWPLMSDSYQQKVDDAYDTFKSEGANKVEQALDVIESVGVNMQDHMIAKARKIFDVWNLSGLSGVPDQTPYSYISPTAWADPDSDDDGWMSLQVSHSDYQSQSSFHSSAFVDSHFKSDSSSTSGSVSASYFGFGAHASAGTSSTSTSSSFQAGSGSQYSFRNDAKNLSISLEYMLCTIERPWLIGDLFYLQNWYLVGNKKNAISDGTIQGQLQDQKPLLPMIPVQFLVVRNVRISASQADWGGDGQTLTRMYTDSQSQGSSWNAGGGAGFNIGFLSIGGEGSHTEGHSSGSFSSRDYTDSDSNYGWSFDGQTLEIRGAQIVAWLSEVVPANAPMDDPSLATSQSQAQSSTAAGQSTAAGATSSTPAVAASSGATPASGSTTSSSAGPTPMVTPMPPPAAAASPAPGP